MKKQYSSAQEIEDLIRTALLNVPKAEETEADDKVTPLTF